MLKKEQGEKKQARRSNTTQPPKAQAKTFQEVKTMPTSEWAKEMNIDVYALAYVRGRTIRKSFFIIDEAQNLTPHEVKTIVTRAGEDTKIIFCGDTFQIDDPYLNEHSNGLSHLIDRMTGKSFFAHIHLSKGERSYLAEEASKYL
jgi:PhoH-like ATPase